MKFALIVAAVFACLLAIFVSITSAQPQVYGASLVEKQGIYFTRPGDEANWMKCIDVPVLGKTCADFYIEPESLTVGVRLLVSGHVILDEAIHGNQVCLGEDQLLKLIELIPALAPFKPIIDGIIKLHKFIPAHIFSVCVHLTDIEVTQQQFSACANLDTTLMCIKDSCLYTGTNDFGCFTLPL